MTTRMSTYRVCDGCGADDAHGGVDWAEHQPRGTRPGATLDLCRACAAQDRAICRHCRRVHDDAYPCAPVRQMRAELAALHCECASLVGEGDTCERCRLLEA